MEQQTLEDQEKEDEPEDGLSDVNNHCKSMCKCNGVDLSMNLFILPDGEEGDSTGKKKKKKKKKKGRK